MSLINCEINLILTWSDNGGISSATGATEFKITGTELYILIVTLSTQDNAKLLEQLKPRFKRTVNRNKYQSKVSIQASNPYLDYLIDPSFQGGNRLFVLSFENTRDRTVHTGYYLPKLVIKDYSVIIDGKTFLTNQ